MSEQNTLPEQDLIQSQQSLSENGAINLKEGVTETYIETITKKELVKLNPYKVKANELYEKYKHLETKEITNREEYDEVKEAEKELGTIRKDTEKDRKVYVKPFNTIVDNINDEAKEITAITDKLEPVLKKKRKDWEDKEAEKKEAEKRAKELKYANRIAELTKMGVLLDGSDFVLDDVAYEAALIKDADDDIYQSMFDAFKAKFDVLEVERKAEADRKAAEQKELDDLRKQKAEMEEFKRQKEENLFQSRLLQLPKMTYRDGKLYDDDTDINTDINTNIPIYSRETLMEASIEKFDEIVKGRLKLLEERRVYREQEEKEKQEAIKKEQERQERIKKRRELVSTLGLVYSYQEMSYVLEGVSISEEQIGHWDEKEFEGLVDLAATEVGKINARKQKEREDAIKAAEKKAADAALAKKAEDDRIAEEKRKEELAAASDKDKWDDFMRQLNTISYPEMKSNKYKGKLKLAKEKIETIIFLQ